MEEVILFHRRRGREGGLTCLISLLFLSGCAFFNPPTFTGTQLREVDSTLSYQDVLTEYRLLSGKKVVVGGQTINLDNRTTRAYVQLAPAPLDSIFRPKAPDGSVPPLMLVFPNPVDPSVMADGRKITVIGKVRRMRRPTLSSSGRTVRLVTIDVLSLHTWVPRTTLIGGSPYPVMTPGFTGPYQVP